MPVFTAARVEAQMLMVFVYDSEEKNPRPDVARPSGGRRAVAVPENGLAPYAAGSSCDTFAALAETASAGC